MSKKVMMPRTTLDTDLERRAVRAWCRTGGDQPARVQNEAVLYRRKPYVVLRNISGVLAVYRIQPS